MPTCIMYICIYLLYCLSQCVLWMTIPEILKQRCYIVNNLKNASQPNIPKLHFNYKSRVLSKFLGNEKFSAADLQAKSETSTHFGNQIL